MEIDFYLCILCASPITLDTFKGTYSVWSSYSGKQRYLENIKEGFVRSSVGIQRREMQMIPVLPECMGFGFSLLVGCLETECPLALW